MLFKLFKLKLFKRECQHIEALLWNHAGGRLNDSERIQVETHLAQCSDCRTHYQAYERTQRGMDALRAQPVPTSAANWQDVRARLSAAQPETNRVPRPVMAWGRGIGWGAVAAAALGLFFWVKTTGHDAEPDHLFTEVDSTKPPKVALVLPPENGETASVVSLTAKSAQSDSVSSTEGVEVLHTASLLPSPLLTAFGTRSGWPQNSLASPLAFKRKTGTTPHTHHLHWRRSPGVWRVHRSHKSPETMLAGTPSGEIIVPVDFGSPVPEYVLTAVQTNTSPNRDFVMDSVDADSPTKVCQYPGQADEETRAW